jgi:ResB-like family
VLGFLDYNLLIALQLDHIYTSDYFLGISALLTASLIACSRTQQWPLLKIAKRWSFPSRPEQVFSKGNGMLQPHHIPVTNTPSSVLYFHVKSKHSETGRTETSAEEV